MNKILIKSEDKKLVNELFWNSFLLEASYNYERQQALGFCVGMWPAIKRFYKTKDEQAKALVRHIWLFIILHLMYQVLLRVWQQQWKKKPVLIRILILTQSIA